MTASRPSPGAAEGQVAVAALVVAAAAEASLAGQKRHGLLEMEAQPRSLPASTNNDKQLRIQLFSEKYDIP